MPLDAPPGDFAILPDDVLRSEAFAAFRALVDENLPALDGVPADEAAVVAWCQTVADLGLDLDEPVAAWALARVPDGATRVALREYATRTLFISTGSLDAIRSSAVATVGDVRNDRASARHDRR